MKKDSFSDSTNLIYHRKAVLQVTPPQPRLFDNAIGLSENKTMKKCSSFANEVRPGTVVIGVILSICKR